jgi:hypothetical protein
MVAQGDSEKQESYCERGQRAPKSGKGDEFRRIFHCAFPSMKN